AADRRYTRPIASSPQPPTSPVISPSTPTIGSTSVSCMVPPRSTPPRSSPSALRPGKHLLVGEQVVVDHPLRRKPALGRAPAGGAIESDRPADRLDGLLDVRDEESGHALVHDLGHRAAWV